MAIEQLCDSGPESISLACQDWVRDGLTSFESEMRDAPILSRHRIEVRDKGGNVSEVVIALTH